MTELEKVIKGLEAHEKGCGYRSHHCDAMECPYRYGDESCDIEEMCHDALTLLKEQEDLGTELTNAVELIHKKNERIEKLLKDQEKKQITLHKKHVITLGRSDEFNMRKLYEAVCETLLDEGELVIVRIDDHEKVDFTFYVTQEST